MRVKAIKRTLGLQSLTTQTCFGNLLVKSSIGYLVVVFFHRAGSNQRLYILPSIVVRLMLCFSAVCAAAELQVTHFSLVERSDSVRSSSGQEVEKTLLRVVPTK